MREFYSLLNRVATHSARKEYKEASACLGAAYMLVRPELERAKSRHEFHTVHDFSVLLDAAARRCNGENVRFEELTFIPSAAHGVRPEKSSLDSRWADFRERDERWFDAACRCPSL